MSVSIDPAATVCLIPEHPCSASMSMRRYWQALRMASRPEDPFSLKSVLELEQESTARAGSLKRYFVRKISYPARIRRHFSGKVAHVLDHSWADMLAHVPESAVKVSTVHDLIPLRFPGGLSAAQVGRYLSWVKCLHLADILIADSAYTGKEMEELLGIPGEKIRVVPLGVDLPPDNVAPDTVLREKITARRTSPDALVIGSIGSVLKRKNLDVLPAALAGLRSKLDRRLVLVRVGQKLDSGLASAIREEIGEDGLLELGSLADAELGGFYHEMDMVVVPSLSEGFGLPVLESMAYGTPVVCSSSTSLPEVGGDAALYFDPNDWNALTEQMAVMADYETARQFGEMGLRRARMFTWRRCLEAVFDVYREGLEWKMSRSTHTA